MSNVNVSVNATSIDVTTTDSNITVSEGNVLVANILTQTNAINVATSNTEITVIEGALSDNQIRGLFSADEPLQYDSANGVFSIDEGALFSGKTTDDLVEGTVNLYLNGSGTTSDLTEGTNLYYTNARVLSYIIDNGLDFNTDKLANALATEGNLTFTYDQANSVITLSESLTTDDIDEGTNLYYTQARFDTAFDNKSTTDLSEGTNLYYTQGRFDTAFDNKSTTDLTEGTNLYYTQGRFDTAFDNKSTTDLTEGTNLYYTQGRFDTAFGNKDTDDLSEGTNLYYTDNRVANFLDNNTVDIQGINLGTVDQTVTSLSSSSNNLDVDLSSGTIFEINLFQDINQVTLQNTALRQGVPFVLIFKQSSSGNHYVNLPESWNYANNFTQIDLTPNSYTFVSVLQKSDSEYFVSIVDTTEQLNIGNLSITGNIETTSGYFIGDGSQLTNLPTGGGNVDSVNGQTGVVVLDTGDIAEDTNLYYTDARANSAIENYNGDIDTSGNITAGYFIGDGSQLTNLPSGGSGNVDSVNGQTGVVVLDTDDIAEGSANLYYTQGRFDTAFGNKSTTDLTEGANLYYTDTRARSALSASGDLSYNSSTGEFSVTTYKSADFDTDFGNKSTTDLSEGTNLYYTDTRARSALSASGDLSYNSTTGEFSVTTYKSSDFDTDFGAKSTTDLAEGTNLYYTQDRFDTAFSNKDTDDLTEGTNLYYTESRANSAIDARVTADFVEALDIDIDAANVDFAPNGLFPANVVTVQAAIDELQIGKLNVDAIASSVTFFPTTANSDITGYIRMVTDTGDPDYNTTAVDFDTGDITGDNVLIGQVASDAGVLNGNTGPINVTIMGQVRRTSGIFTAGDLYFEVYKRDASDVETLIGTSFNTIEIDEPQYEQFSAMALIQDTNFTETDRVVFKWYANANTGTFRADIQIGGSTPVRGSFPVPVSVVPIDHNASNVTVDTSEFDGLLSASDDTVQKALNTLDDVQLYDDADVTALLADFGANNIVMEGNITSANGTIITNTGISQVDIVRKNYDAYYAQRVNPGTVIAMGYFVPGGTPESQYVVLETNPPLEQSDGNTIIRVEFEGLTGQTGNVLNGNVFYLAGDPVADGYPADNSESALYVFTDETATTPLLFYNLWYEGFDPDSGFYFTDYRGTDAIINSSYTPAGDTDWSMKQPEADGSTGSLQVSVTTPLFPERVGARFTSSLGLDVTGGITSGQDIEALGYTGKQAITLSYGDESLTDFNGVFAINGQAVGQFKSNVAYNQTSRGVTIQGADYNTANVSERWQAPSINLERMDEGVLTLDAQGTYRDDSGNLWTGVYKTGVQARRDIVDSSNTDNILSSLGRVHETTGIVSRTSESNTYVVGTQLRTQDTKFGAPIYDGRMSFRTSQAAVLLQANTFIPYQEVLSNPASTVFFIEDKFYIGDETNDDATAYSFPKTAGQPGQALVLGSGNSLEWQTVVTADNFADYLRANQALLQELVNGDTPTDPDYNGGDSSTTIFEFTADGGDSSTTSFASTVDGGDSLGGDTTDGGDSSTTNFAATIDGGTSGTTTFTETVTGGDANGTTPVEGGSADTSEFTSTASGGDSTTTTFDQTIEGGDA